MTTLKTLSPLDRMFMVRPIVRDLAMDIKEKNGYMFIKMSLPEIEPRDIDITLKQNTVTVRVLREEEEEEVDEKNYNWKEVRRGSFSATALLPSPFDASRAKAEYRNGILTVSIPLYAPSHEDPVKVKVNENEI